MAVLFTQMYEEGKNISLEATLLEAAQRAGLDESAARDALHSPEMRRKMLAEDEQAKNEGVEGVPFFKIFREGGPRRPLRLSGAQSPAVFLRAFRQVLQQQP